MLHKSYRRSKIVNNSQILVSNYENISLYRKLTLHKSYRYYRVVPNIVSMHTLMFSVDEGSMTTFSFMTNGRWRCGSTSCPSTVSVEMVRCAWSQRGVGLCRGSRPTVDSPTQHTSHIRSSGGSSSKDRPRVLAAGGAITGICHGPLRNWDVNMIVKCWFAYKKLEKKRK